MTPLEIEAGVNALIILSQFLIAQVNNNTDLTDEQKKVYLDRISSIQDLVKSSKF